MGQLLHSNQGGGHRPHSGWCEEASEGEGGEGKDGIINSELMPHAAAATAPTNVAKCSSIAYVQCQQCHANHVHRWSMWQPACDTQHSTGKHSQYQPIHRPVRRPGHPLSSTTTSHTGRSRCTQAQPRRVSLTAQHSSWHCHMAGSAPSVESKEWHERGCHGKHRVSIKTWGCSPRVWGVLWMQDDGASSQHPTMHHWTAQSLRAHFPHTLWPHPLLCSQLSGQFHQ